MSCLVGSVKAFRREGKVSLPLSFLLLSPPKTSCLSPRASLLLPSGSLCQLITSTYVLTPGSQRIVPVVIAGQRYPQRSERLWEQKDKALNQSGRTISLLCLACIQ